MTYIQGTPENNTGRVTLIKNMIDFERQKFFWSRVRKDGEHLIWTGSTTTRQYGKIEIEGRNEYAHRVAYCIAHNLSISDIDGIMILKTCYRNDCVEPTHLIKKVKRKGLTEKAI